MPRPESRPAVLLWPVVALAVACSSTGTTDDGGGIAGSSGAAGTGGVTGAAGAGAAGRGGTAGGAAGGSGGAQCPANQVWCPGCTPGTGTCTPGGCPGFVCPPVDAGVSCGTEICASGQLCVRPSCGGAPPLCQATADGGTCPTGWTFRQYCPQSGTTGCEPPPCMPPAPYCLTPPATCPAKPTCSCLPTTTCKGGGGCSLITSSEILCASA